MPRFTLYVTIVFMLAIVAGGCHSHAPIGSDEGQSSQSAADASAGTANSQIARESDESLEDSEAAESTKNTVIESDSLKQAMIDVAADLLREQQDDIDLDAIREQIEEGIALIREDFPDFLMVSAENEKKLQAGTPIGGADQRIARAEAFLNECRVECSRIVVSLLEQHKTGGLSPVHTELLAQVIVMHEKQIEDAMVE